MSSLQIIQPRKEDKRYAHQDKQRQFSENHVSGSKSFAANGPGEAKRTEGRGERHDWRKS